jgi:catechol 2,3-dioxygenase-like lactoylglutathione lyase family enzyme
MRFVHTNIIARDWRALADFYQRLFGCTPVPPERDYHSPALDAGTGLRGAHLTGMHLRLPGYDDRGPTLEIYSYDSLEPKPPSAANRLGFAHIAFEVDDVVATREEVLRGGGSPVGDVVTLQIATGARVTWCYVRDPEDNIVELQSWS